MNFWISALGIAATLSLAAILCITALDAYYTLRSMSRWNEGRVGQLLILTACVSSLIGITAIIFVAVAR